MNNVTISMPKFFDMAGSTKTFKKAGKSSFMDLMAMLTGKAGPEKEGISGIMESMLGGTPTENTAIDSIDSELLSIMENFLNSGDLKEKDNVYAYMGALISNIAGMQMLGISEPADSLSEPKYMTDDVLEAIGANGFGYLRKYDDFEKNLNELLGFKSTEKEFLGKPNEFSEITEALIAKSGKSEETRPEALTVHMEEITAGKTDSHDDGIKSNADIGASAAGEGIFQKYDSSIIEVSDESSQIRPSLSTQVKDKIVLMANENKDIQEVTLELFPKNLGKVNIKMSIKDNSIIIDILASSDKTKNILMENTDELLGSLQKSLNDKSVHITIMNSNAAEQERYASAYEEQQRENQRNNRGRYVNHNDSREEDEAEESFREMMNLRDLVLNKL